MDTQGSVEQTLRIVEAGGRIVRLTAPGTREAVNIGLVRQRLRERGCEVPIVADIHFNPKAALAAAECCDKVRINPGNFVDPGRTFVKLDFTDEEYAAEIAKIDKALQPLLDVCSRRGTALRIGVNHGSLSDRIMSRYGDTPDGMVESAMEFLRVCVARGFRNVVISIKASNVKVMVATTRKLVDAMERESMMFPLHLGVTEAGDGEDARIKSAVGIGSLLAEGIGDTIRVSLSEPPENEIPVARAIADYAMRSTGGSYRRHRELFGEGWTLPERRQSVAVGAVGGANRPVVATTNGDAAKASAQADRRPDFIIGDDCLVVDVDSEPTSALVRRIADEGEGKVVVAKGSTCDSADSMIELGAALDKAGLRNPLIIAMAYDAAVAPDDVAIRAAVDLGRVLMAGIGAGVMVESPRVSPGQCANLGYGLLQSTRLRMTRTEYIACPGCGRTLYDLQSTLKSIKEATSQLKGLKIGVMGCIVNGPGEMADADYGYVGAGPGKVSLYKGKKCVVKNIPAEQAVDRLIELIKAEGDWK